MSVTREKLHGKPRRKDHKSKSYCQASRFSHTMLSWKTKLTVAVQLHLTFYLLAAACEPSEVRRSVNYLETKSY